MSDSLYEPIGYDRLWFVLGVVMVVALVAWLVYVFASTRPPRPIEVPPIPLRHSWETARVKALDDLGDIENRWLVGDLGDRELHVELSALVRDFAKDRAGIHAAVLTLAELQRNSEARPVAGLIARYYRPEFAQTSTTDGQKSIDAARGVIEQW